MFLSRLQCGQSLSEILSASGPTTEFIDKRRKSEMELKQLEVFSEASNYGIVRMPGRNFPGCVIQGDSLSILCSFARSIHQRVVALDDEELSGDTAEMLDLLEGRLKHYEEVLKQHDIPLPYFKQ